MPRINYKDTKLKKPVLSVIEQVNSFLDEQPDYRFTVRQLFYQFISNNLMPNTRKTADKLSRDITKGRENGLIDWDRVVDRGRNLNQLGTWESPQEILKAAVESFRTDKWSQQAYWPEVWIEKQALLGVIQDVCEELEVPYYACRGFDSASMCWRAAYYRFDNLENTPIVLHFADHDPAGWAMTEDLRQRLNLYSMRSREILVERIALTKKQAKNFPSQPLKKPKQDKFVPRYVEETGCTVGWELDALNPAELIGLIRQTVLNLRDDTVWDESVKWQEHARNWLKRRIPRK
ncbi:MAG: hypothetical protein R6V46_15205 [Desulfatiglandaceae bacterium]